MNKMIIYESKFKKDHNLAIIAENWLFLIEFKVFTFWGHHVYIYINSNSENSK